MKWSVALFGHQKFIPDIDVDPVEHAAAIKRAKPGDVVAFKPYEANKEQWTPTENKQFLIVIIDGVTKEQMQALCEAEWDIESYPKYKPQSLLESENQGINHEKYLEQYKNTCRMPTVHKNKRRFQIKTIDLESKGIELNRMLNTADEYKPLPEFSFTEVTDILKGRKVEPTDGLNMIKPLTDTELEARKV